MSTAIELIYEAIRAREMLAYMEREYPNGQGVVLNRQDFIARADEALEAARIELEE